MILIVLISFILAVVLKNKDANPADFHPGFSLAPADSMYFNSFVDCNMAEAWVGETFRIFPGKYGEDPLWGNSRDLKFADGRNPEEAFARKPSDFKPPHMPPDARPGKPGLHGAVWFETVYQDSTQKDGKTLFAVYHNENYPSTLPYDTATKKGYKDFNWPQGLRGPKSPAAVCRIGIMRSDDGGHSWTNQGLFLEDDQPRLILKPHNTSMTFAGGTGDPSAVASNGYLYLFYGEYGYPGVYDSAQYDSVAEWRGQCISVARISLKDLDAPEGKGMRWGGKAFDIPWDSVGIPIRSLQIPRSQGGGPASSPRAGYYWGPSVSWNSYLGCWVMLMAKATGPSWAGSSIFISFNKNTDLGAGKNSQDWTIPQLLLDKPGWFLWYPSLQPLNTPGDIADRNTCLKLGRTARLFVKYIRPNRSEYKSEYLLTFKK